MLEPRDPREVVARRRRVDHALDHARPDDPQRLWIGISAAGVFRTEDGGATWQPANVGTEACFLPEDRFPEVGQCVHKLLAHPGKPGRLWQQNHCGVYRSDDHGQAGNGSRGTDFRRDSGSVSRSIRAIPTARS